MRDVRRLLFRSLILRALMSVSGNRAELVSERSDQASCASAIGTAITRLHRQHYGRGATKTRTMYNRDHVVCFLEDIYTPVERTLLDAGEHDAVKHTRQVFQMAMRQQFSEAVEEITGRKVIQFMSQVCFEPDMAAEIFVLEPRTTEAATAPE